MKKKIRIFELKFDHKFRKNFTIGVKKIFDQGFLTNHSYVKKLESKFSKINSSKFSIAVNSGTAALELIFRSLNVKNKKVLIASNTFVATALAVKSAGGIPVPIDIEKRYFSLCPIQLKKKISQKNISAVVIIHIAGLVSPNIYRIKKICDEKKIPLIEDCAQAYGSTLNNKKVGNFGLAGAFSFQTTKVVTSGEGGIVTTNNKKFFMKLISNRFYGVSLKETLNFVSDGNNLKMPELIALAAICDLDRSKERIKKRIKIAKRYQYLLKNSDYKTLSPPQNSTSSYYKQIIFSKHSRKKIEQVLNSKNISLTGGVYYVPLHRQPTIGIKNDKLFPNSSYFSDNHFCPPCYPELELSDIDYICKVLLSIK